MSKTIDWVTLPFLSLAEREAINALYLRMQDGDASAGDACLQAIPALLMTCAEYDRRINEACSLLSGSVSYQATASAVLSGLFSAYDVEMRRHAVMILRNIEGLPSWSPAVLTAPQATLRVVHVPCADEETP